MLIVRWAWQQYAADIQAVRGRKGTVTQNENEKLYLINVDYMPTNEAPLKKFAAEGYEVKHMKGTCHFPMLENPKELNEKLHIGH
jgi:hypothetical protein